MTSIDPEKTSISGVGAALDEAVQDNFAEGLCTLDRRGQVLTINPAGQQILGWSFSELRGSDLHDKVHRRCANNGVGSGAECRLLMALAQCEESVEQDHVFIRKDGTALGIRCSVSPLVENGETAGSIVVFRDVTGRKAVETRLRESEARFARFMQNLPGLAWIKDSEGRYAYANDAAEKAFRTEREALYGKTDFDVFSEELAREFVKNDRDALEKGNLQTVEVLEDENGLPRYSIVNKFAIPVEGAASLVGGIAIDITEQKRAQEDQEFLFSISEAIRVSREPNLLMAYISGALGKYLGVHRCLFNEIDIENDIETVHSDYSRTGESVAGRHKISDYSPLASANMESGQTVVNRDSKTDPRTAEFYEKTYAPNKELAYMAVPMLRGGKWVASLWCSDDRPRDWTMREVALVENIAERAWSAVERLRTEDLLRRSQEMFSTLVEAAPFGVYSIDSDFRILSVNKGAEAVFRGIEPLIGRDFAEVLGLIWTEPFATEAVEKFRNTLNTGEPYLSPTITEYRAGQDSTETYDWQIHRIMLADGTFGVVCYFYDLTHQKRLEAEVRRTAAMDAYRLTLADALRSLADPVEIQLKAATVLGEFLAADRVGYAEDGGDGQTVSVTRNYVKGVPGLEGVYNYDDYGRDLRTELLTGKTLVRADVANEDSLTATQKKAYAALQLGAMANRPLVKEGRLAGMLFIHYKAAHAWSQDELALLEETAERSWVAMERARALQREREAEAALREKEAELETIIYGTPFMLTRCGRDLRYKYVSPAYAEMVGLSFSEIAGRPIVEVLGERGFETIRPHVERVLSGETVQYETNLELQNAGPRDITVVYSPERTETGEVIGWIASLVDITERKRAEEALRESRERLRRAHDELERRVHDRTRDLADLNETLRKEIAERERSEAVKIGLLQRIVSAQETERQRIARDIHDQLGQRLTALRLKLAALRSVCGNENGEIARVERLQEIAHLLDSEISFLASELRPNTLDDLGLEAALRAHASDWSRHYDTNLEFHASIQIGRSLGRDTEIQLYRIAQEALNNVAKHARATQVNLLLEQTAESLVLIIEDNGVGFDEKATKTRRSGRGMGLVGMNERASLIGAAIEIESEKGSGTTIFVRLPMNSQAEEG